MRKKAGTGELDLIAGIRARVAPIRASGELILGMGDDCALLRPARNEDLAVTTDQLLENVHFRRGWHPPESVGHRALARGLSDLAAMGARPLAAFLSLALPAELAGDWLSGFLNGWTALARKFRVPLAGGDTAESPRPGNRGGLLTADVVLIGAVRSGRALLRSGARAGDVLYVTGPLGGAAAELRAIRRDPVLFCKKKRSPHPHLYPEPRLEIGRRLAGRRLATAAIDLSDGLSTDLMHLCVASGLGAVIDREAVPVAPGASFADAIHGGEDYELLFTAPSGRRIRSVARVEVYAIGRMTRPGSPVELRVKNGSRTTLPAGGWEHFRS